MSEVRLEGALTTEGAQMSFGDDGLLLYPYYSGH